MLFIRITPCSHTPRSHTLRSHTPRSKAWHRIPTTGCHPIRSHTHRLLPAFRDKLSTPIIMVPTQHRRHNPSTHHRRHNPPTHHRRNTPTQRRHDESQRGTLRVATRLLEIQVKTMTTTSRLIPPSRQSNNRRHNPHQRTLRVATRGLEIQFWVTVPTNRRCRPKTKSKSAERKSPPPKHFASRWIRVWQFRMKR